VTHIATTIESPPVHEPVTLGSPPTPSPDDAGVLEEVLVEEVSIDGMCGVY
jgi:mycofactocin precursor